MNVSESENNIKTVDINELLPKKSKGRPPGAKNKKNTKPTENKIQSMEEKLSEKEKLQEELLRLADYNESVITKPVNDKIAKLVDDMSIEELKARIRSAKRNQSSKMDTNVAEQTILLTNQMMGTLLGCLEELNESSLKDELLKECTKEYLCLNILDYIPMELKLGGIYSSHLASSYYKAKAKRTPFVSEMTDSSEIKAGLASPEMQNKLANLKARLKGLAPPPPPVENIDETSN